MAGGGGAAEAMRGRSAGAGRSGGRTAAATWGGTAGGVGASGGAAKAAKGHGRSPGFDGPEFGGVAVMAVVKRRLGGRRSGAERQARPSRIIGGDHVAGRDQHPEQEEQRQRGRESAPVPDAADHAPHARNLTRPPTSHSPNSRPGHSNRSLSDLFSEGVLAPVRRIAKTFRRNVRNGTNPHKHVIQVEY